ncbi:MAG TPA: 4-hydroxy-tetrahydrodipicolinate synthase [Desulfobacterales bacterium]|nr:4-hydroxy-tetrahydrodipicolinate synthase [Desulfobacterales bacterium]
MAFKPFGIIPAMVTPLTPEGRINEAALRKFTDYLIRGGSHGLFVVGTTGEFYGLSPEEKRELFRITVDQVKGRVPVYAGTGAITTREAIQLTRLAEEAGADAVSVLTPMFISPSQKELIRHYTAIAESTRLPVLLYNNPPKTGVNLAAGTVAKLAEVPNIVGIKDSSGDFTLTGEYLRLTRGKEFHVLLGRDTLIYAGLCYGATGSIAACANVAPRLVADIYDKYVAGDLKGALEAQYTLAPLRIAFTLGSFPAVIKESLELLGIDAGACMEPVGPMSAEEKEQLKKILKEMGLLK